MSCGTLTTGAVVSRTVTLKEPSERLPRLSDAEQETVDEPRGKVEPEAGRQTVAPGRSTRSTAVTLYETTAPSADVASRVFSAGTFRAGPVVSSTATWKLFEARLPPASEAEPGGALVPFLSVAVQATADGPRPKVLPELGVHDVSTGPSTRSVAETPCT